MKFLNRQNCDSICQEIKIEWVQLNSIRDNKRIHNIDRVQSLKNHKVVVGASLC